MNNIGENTPASRLFDVVNYILLGLLTLVTLYPLWYVLIASFSNFSLFSSNEGLMVLPLGFNLSAYIAVFRDPMILKGYSNTILYVALGTAINLLMTINGAYILSRKSFCLNRVLTIMVIITMFFSGGLIPMFLLVRSLGMYDSMWALIVPYAINTWNMLIMRNSFEAIPESLVESAKIDGANDLQILVKIILPMSTAIIAVVSLYYFAANWNAWFHASIYLRKREQYPLQLILREILINNQMDTGGSGGYAEIDDIKEIMKYATIVIATAPMLIVYPFLQRFFVRGIMVGAVKE